jgi:hypothetical protein
MGAVLEIPRDDEARAHEAVFAGLVIGFQLEAGQLSTMPEIHVPWRMGTPRQGKLVPRLKPRVEAAAMPSGKGTRKAPDLPLLSLLPGGQSADRR